MRFIFGVICALALLFGSIVALDYLGYGQKIAPTAESGILIEKTELVGQGNGSTTETKTDTEIVEKPAMNDDSQVVTETNEVTPEPEPQTEGIVVRQGSDMAITEPVANSGGFVSTETGEKVEDAEIINSPIPQNINLFISESAKRRLTSDDLDKLPKNIVLAIWPDSILAGSGYKFYLQTPPVDIMESYELKNIVNDDKGLYMSTFPASEGIFVRKLEVLAQATPLSKLIYSQMAEKDKTMMLFSGYIDPQLNKTLDETQVDFQRIDFLIDQNQTKVSVKRQWDAIVEKAAHGEELNILFELTATGIDELVAAIGK